MTKTKPNYKKKKPVILQLLPDLKSGGVERGTVEIAKALQENGFGSIVCSAGGQMVTNVVNCGATHITLPVANKNPFTILRNAKKLRKIIDEYEVDIIHARSRAPAWSGYLACKKSGCHFVTTFHGVYSITGAIKRKYNKVMTKGEKVIAVSEFIKNHIIENYKIDAKKIEVIHRGADISQFNREAVPERRILQQAEKLRIEHDRPIILLPGRMTSWKGHEFLLDALAQLDKDKFLCLFVGNIDKHPAYVKKIDEKIESLRLTGSVRIIKDVRDMPALYSLADIVVSASMRPEAFGRIAIEAQAMERLLVATNHGGACETVIDGKTGWLVDAGDVDELAKILYKLLNLSDKQRKTVTNKAKKHIQDKFSLEQMTKKTIDLYKSILKEGKNKEQKS